ncbi:MAG: class I SAM-dependent methyltransferase [Chitinophagales bacterium]|nr:class I SAM-dependent methyltransferase [Chitinophagales bacterium]
MKQKEWFETWFDSPYYHILYQQHDHQEAERMIETLFKYLELPASAKILDVACGRGRHSIYMAEKGYTVAGIDLSWKNIQYAQRYEQDNLSFFVHDMRKPFYINYFDAVLNLFTSFGYFSCEKDNLKAMRSISDSLQKKGRVIIDFFNAKTIANKLPYSGQISHDGIMFYIVKAMEDGTIRKKIYFQDLGKEYEFEERVQALQLADFAKYFANSGLVVKDVFGDYQLNSFDESLSERLIIIGEKI